MSEQSITKFLWKEPSPKHANFKRRQRRKAAKARQSVSRCQDQPTSQVSP